MWRRSWVEVWRGGGVEVRSGLSLCTWSNKQRVRHPSQPDELDVWKCESVSGCTAEFPKKKGSGYFPVWNGLLKTQAPLSWKYFSGFFFRQMPASWQEQHFKDVTTQKFTLWLIRIIRPQGERPDCNLNAYCQQSALIRGFEPHFDSLNMLESYQVLEPVRNDTKFQMMRK